MEELTPQERFNQLRSFLKNPEKHTFTRTGDRYSPIWSIAFPALNLEDIIYLPGKKRHNGGMVHELCQEAIEIMDSAMFHNGVLRGNQRTPDIEIEHIEEFVLQMAAVIHLARAYIAKSLPEVRSHTFDGKLSVYDELRIAWDDLWKAFLKVADIALENGLIRPDKLMGLNPQKRAELGAQIEKLYKEGKSDEIEHIFEKEKKKKGGVLGELVVMRAKSLAEAHHKEIKGMETSGFDAINELIRIFITNFTDYPTRPNYTTKIYSLMAEHIWTLIIKYSDKKPRELPGPDAIRKRIPLIRKQSYPHH